MFELFQMKENETNTEMITRFTNIMNSLETLEKEYSSRDGKKCTSSTYTQLGEENTAIEKANNLSTLTLENLIENLIVYGVHLQERRMDNYQRRKFFPSMHLQTPKIQTMKKMTLR